MSRAGFVATVGRPNAGKSTLLNYLVQEKVAMVSHKQNATRKRLNIIVMDGENQLIFVDTPGLHKREKLLNQFMLQEALNAISDCDLILFLSPISDSLEHYEEFLSLSKDKPHIVLITKCDGFSSEEIAKKLQEFEKYSDKFLEILPFSIKRDKYRETLIKTVSKYLPNAPHFYDPEILTDSHLRELYKEFIRESLFDNLSDELPYESDVIIDKIEEGERLDRVFATIIVEKSSQKMVVIGEGGKTIKRIGKSAREKIEALSGKKIYLELFVSIKKGWSKDKASLKDLGYEI